MKTLGVVVIVNWGRHPNPNSTTNHFTNIMTSKHPFLAYGLRGSTDWLFKFINEQDAAFFEELISRYAPQAMTRRKG